MSENNFLPEKILKKEWITTYWEQHRILLNEIYNLNSYLHICERLKDFPFYLFTEPSTNIWDYFFRGSYHSLVLIINKISLDRRKDVFTLDNFRENIENKFIKESNKQIFIRGYKKIDFYNRLEPYKNILENERHINIAHLNKNKTQNTHYDGSITAPIINQKLKQVNSLINEYFHFLSLGIDWAETHRQYIDKSFFTFQSTNFKSDIEELLDLVAKNSYLLNMPEKEPAVWDLKKEELSTDELMIFNKYRQKFNLPEL